MTPGDILTIIFSPAIIADGDVGSPDFVYYERPNLALCSGICMDFVKVEISPDGVLWYQVFYWVIPHQIPILI